MADLSKIKKRNSLGTPPSLEEASLNLAAPEIAPVMPQQTHGSTTRIDGRGLRKTNRIIQFATKVTPEFDERFRARAVRDGIELCVLLEKAFEFYEENIK